MKLSALGGLLKRHAEGSVEEFVVLDLGDDVFLGDLILGRFVVDVELCPSVSTLAAFPNPLFETLLPLIWQYPSPGIWREYLAPAMTPMTMKRELRTL